MLIPSVILGQDFGFDVDINSGSITSVLLREGSQVYKVSTKIEEIYFFTSVSEAKLYLQNPKRIDRPRKIVHLEGVSIYVDSIVSMDYYKVNYSYGKIGQIKSINNTVFEYVPDYNYNRSANIVGRLAKVGSNKITYFTQGGYGNKGEYLGKIKSFNAMNFKYEMWSSWGEKVGMVGKLINLGTLTIKYYETDYDVGYKGKLRSIGGIDFIYFKDNYNNRKANIVGRFKQRTGYDSRIVIY